MTVTTTQVADAADESSKAAVYVCSHRVRSAAVATGTLRPGLSAT
ncbi:MAG TPA: hypothetical protein VG327_10855 [Mycobacterium sp.]|nr:hypothetical protein [Mycobacterium sp.]